ncbi:MAG: bifunctional glutamate N-acetyltransferase/amino-acid acetyltransferase ArgJ [Clostridiales bacterium]|nr:bifunctional glutamate N-acetyltransferase/amino-acid acetyltransferase ArgJ [Clostridiales bacterium]
MRIIDGGVTAPQGFRAAGRHIGIKKVKKDLSLLVSDTPAIVAGVFTQNLVRAAHIVWDEKIVKEGKKVRGLVTVSGNANACTGEQGVLDNEQMAGTFAGCLQVKSEEILTAATGIIGLRMPMDVIRKGICDTFPMISSRREDAKNAAAGIITTDTFLKEIAVSINIAGKVVHIGAMAKGSGMVHPNMATVLSFVTTDACISRQMLQKALNTAIYDTYNMISVDGATSTNDMALVLANGLAGNPEINREDDIFFEMFQEALLFIHRKLAMDIVHDGEGSKKFVEVKVCGAKSEEDARKLAKGVVTNDLVKTAMYGEDANWGRVVAAMGGSGGYFTPELADIAFESEKGLIQLMRKGEPIRFDENLAAEILGEQDIIIDIFLGDGTSSATAWGCDLGHEYVRINGEYRSRT